jgi:hypothetical protein
MPTTSLAKRNARKSDGMLMEESIAHLMNMKETAEYFYGDKKKRSGKEQQLRLMALLCTIKTAAQVGVIFGVNERIVQRARRMYRDELKDASISRNMIVAGLAERKAIETLQKLNVDNVADDKKGRLIKDLMDSSALANDKIKPPEEKKDISVKELIFRITERKSSTLPKPPDPNDDDVIEGELVEPTQITKGTP